MRIFGKKKSGDIPRRRQQSGARREYGADDQNVTFRRNRTLTGSLSSQVTSAAEPSGDLQSSRTHAHHLALQRRKIMAVLGAVLLVTLFLASLLYSFTAYPRVSSSDSINFVETRRYEDAINDYLNVHPFERLRFALDSTKLTTYLRQAVPEVALVQQDGFAKFGTTNFNLTMRQPIASWIIGGKQYFVDENGIPFAQNYYESPVVAVVDQSGVQQAAGTAVASSRFLAFVGKVVAEAQKRDTVVQQAIIPASTTRQLEVKIEGREYPIKLSLDRGAAVQVEDMKRAVEYFESRRVTPQYIDVRVSGRAYYK